MGNYFFQGTRVVRFEFQNPIFHPPHFLFSGEDAKNLIFSPSFKNEDRQIELSRAAQIRRQRIANEREAKNHLIRNRQALKEKQQHNKKSVQEKEARESLLLQQREKKKHELYGEVQSRVNMSGKAMTAAASPTEDCHFSLSSSHKSYGKVPTYISNRKSKIESEMWGC